MGIKTIAVGAGALVLSTVVNANTLHLDPGLRLSSFLNSDPWSGRGVVFRAEENFTMTSFGMDLSFSGNVDFSIDVYEVAGNSRGSLISQSIYSNLSDDGSPFFTLDHTQSFLQNNLYEVVLRYQDPSSIAFNYYNYSNDDLDIAAGFNVGTELRVLDGTDFENYTNSWLANFTLNTSDIGVVPVPAALWLFCSGLIGLIGMAVRNKA